MPVIRFEVAELERLLGKPMPRKDLAESIPLLGADVEDWSGETWAVEFFPDRPDLFTVEGIARALRSLLGVAPGLAKHVVAQGRHSVVVDAGVVAIRPFIAAAFVRGVTVTQARLDALIELQEDLHWGLGARRSRVAIGIHDASVLAPDFVYKAVAREALQFVPLQESASMTPADILAKHPKGVDYAHLLKDHAKVPIILDAKGGVVSMPPIINAARTTVTTATRDLFVDVTGTDAWAVERALNIIVAALADAGGALESVDVVAPDGSRRATPDLSPEVRELAVAEVNRLLGMEFSAGDVVERLRRMGFGAEAAGPLVRVEVPAWRVDVLHAWDLIEDVAIGHGLRHFEGIEPRALTTGVPIAENLEAERVRASLVGLGFLEAVSLTLSNPRDQFERLQRAPIPCVEVKNPVTEDHTMLRVSLLPGLLGILKKNAHRDLPQRVFEVGMVCRIENGRPLYERRVAGVVIQGRSNFSDVKGIALALARDLGRAGAVVSVEDAAFLRGRAASLDGEGVFGEVHPAVLEAFGLSHPVMAFELRVAAGPGERVRGSGLPTPP